MVNLRQQPSVLKWALWISQPTTETSSSLCGIQLDKKSSEVWGMVITLEPELDLSSSRWTREPPTKMFPLGFAILFAFAKTSLLSLSEQRPISRYNEINIITVNSSELFSLSQERKVKTAAVTFHRKKGLQYYEISSKSNYNVDKPMLSGLRKITG